MLDLSHRTIRFIVEKKEFGMCVDGRIFAEFCVYIVSHLLKLLKKIETHEQKF